MRAIPMSPAAVKREQWAELYNRHVDHGRARQLRSDQQEVWEEMICQEIEGTNKTIQTIAQEYGRCNSTISRTGKKHKRGKR